VRPGPQATGEGSFGRNAGIQVGRAVLLVALALIIGVVLLRRVGGGGAAPTTAASTGTTSTTAKSTAGGKTATTAPAATTTTTTPARPASAVKVLVANGSTVRGLAGLIATKLHTAGYNTLAVVNATQQVTASLVYFQPGYQKEAAAVAGTLGVAATAVQPTPSPPPVTNLSTANVLVVAGPDLGSTASTSTTVRTATTLHTTTTTAKATTTTTVRATTTTTR
jgi:hypothetical protein